ncbi:MAG: hypothetical protein QX196_05190 [Methylococcaceae bacterium]
MTDNKTRFLQVMQLVDKEALHLEQIIDRFFEEKDTIPPEWLEEKLKTATDIDQLESFSAKFSRLQDTLGGCPKTPANNGIIAGLLTLA